MRPLRTALAIWLTAVTLAACGPSAELDPEDWSFYKTQFLALDGRVIDTGNGGISHSESQGTGLLLAVYYDDREAFERIWTWTDSHLRKKEPSGLFAWKWDPKSHPHIGDPNNATDGDLMIAWALAIAAQKWQRSDYAHEARVIAGAIRTHLTREIGGLTLLAPGAVGFDRPNGLTVNLSYALFPAFDALAKVDPHPNWKDYASSYRKVIDRSRFGSFGLPADWIDLDTKPEAEGRWHIEPANDYPPRFGYEAIRIPLYLKWGERKCKGACARIARFWAKARGQDGMPAWIDVTTENTSEYAASAGFEAVRHFVGKKPDSTTSLTGRLDYYSASLVMLTRLATVDTGA